MKNVQRHILGEKDIAWQIKLNEKLLSIDENKAKNDPEQLSLRELARNTRDYLLYLSVVEPDSVKICPLLYTTIHATVGLFQQALSVGEPLQVTINPDLVITLTTTGPASTTHPSSWLSGFFAAMIRRDAVGLNALSEIPLDVLRQSSTRTDEYMYLYVEVLQALWRRDKQLGQKLVEAARATDPEKLEDEAQDHALYLVVPALNLLFQFLKNDVAQFNQVLYSGLEDHKKFWSANKERSKKPYGFLAWPLLAIASFAYDLKMPIEVESEYLPLRLLHGECGA